MSVKPMLAESFSFPHSSGTLEGKKWNPTPLPPGYTFPHLGWWASIKYDGVRALWTGKDLQSRNGHELKAPDWFLSALPEDMGLDGELFGGPHSFAVTSGHVRRKSNQEGWKTITFMVFDLIHPKYEQWPFQRRYQKLKQFVDQVHQQGCDWIQLVKQTEIKSTAQVYEFYQHQLKQGGEGIMLRDPVAQYEHKRSTLLLKWKPIKEMEGRVVGFTEGKGANQGILGSFQVEMIHPKTQRGLGKFFQLAGRIDRSFRQQYRFDAQGRIRQLPENEELFPVLGSLVTFSYMVLTSGGLPRQPIFLRVRHQE